MNLKRLEYFVTLAHSGSLERAAELLHLSPPALSKSMKVLEDELEVSLWTKSGRKIVLSEQGIALLKKAPRLLDELNALKESLHTNRDFSRPVRIATFEVFSTYFLGFIEKIKWESTPLELHELLPGEVEKYVAQGDVDFGISYMPVPYPDLDFLKVCSIEMGVFTRKGAFQGIQQHQLPYVVPVMPIQGTPTKVRGLDGWPETAYRRKVLHQVTLMESALELCRQGRVAGYFPAFIVNEHNKRVKDQLNLERRRLVGSPVCRSDVYIIKRKSSEESPLIRQMAKAIRLMCV